VFPGADESREMFGPKLLKAFSGSMLSDAYIVSIRASILNILAAEVMLHPPSCVDPITRIIAAYTIFASSQDMKGIQ